MCIAAGPSASRAWGESSPCAALLLAAAAALLVQLCAAFNLDTDTRVVFTGPPRSYFGYSVEFFGNSSSYSILIGAPKANTSQPNVTEGGAVYSCPWSQTNCSIIHFDKQGDRYFYVNDVNTQVEFKSHQWFGATVRSHGNSILACAPRYYWRTEHDTPFADVTGTCYLSVDGLKTFVEYAPCRTERHGPAGQGYCQGGFSADFTKDGRVVLGGPGSFYWQGQLISATTDEIVKAYYPSYFLLSVNGQIQTKQVQGSYDDSYLGYSVAGGEFSGDDEEDFITGVPKGLMLYGLVSILNGSNLKSMINLTGEQMGSYFGYAVAATDINNDGLDDLVVGAPMFMRRGTNGRLEELGKVYVYLQKGPLLLEPSQSNLIGPQAFSRFGSSLAPLGDLNQDGFNDMAIGCPYGGDDQQGLVLIYNGHAEGLMDTPSQTLSGQWASSSFPASFGFALRGNRDLDQNGYPDLIVGAFGADKAVLYRARPIVSASASLTVQPTMFNQEEKTCRLINEATDVSCVSITFCLLAKGKHLPSHLGFVVEVQLDSVKKAQKESTRRTLFLDSQQPSLVKTLSLTNGEPSCHDSMIYLRGEEEFRDKLSPIHISLNFSLDPQAAVAEHGLRPILDYQTVQLIEQKAHIQLDCGEDNICVPDLKLAVIGDRTEVYLGDENSLSLIFNARNEGEGGAYEAELYVVLPQEADYSGIARNNVSLTQLTCSYEAENQTRYLLCDLGNPMEPGSSIWAGLRFTVPRLKDTNSPVQFELQIRSKNVNNSESDVVLYELEVAAVADVILQGVSRPDKVIFPPPNWTIRQTLREEQDIGPELQQVYELVNNGPSAVSHSTLEVRCPLRTPGHELLYPVEVVTEGPLSCSSRTTINALKLKLQPPAAVSLTSLKPNSEHHIHRREVYSDPLAEHGNLTCSTVECWHLQCDAGLLERGASVILTVRSRLWAETFVERAYKQYILECSVHYKVERMPYSILPKSKPLGSKKVVTAVMWNKPDSMYSVPVWIIILAVLAGLLLLSLLIYLLYKMGFFKRSDPYGTTMEKAQLKPQASSEA
ncbi:integrin alpha-5 isoform X1 [Pleuronectes platessa]|uniref:integrin alpha-5 isoform X1 n=1 Tax=Pleuronectes platessa TaxID=8262 RepID=UPI00232A445E|nr:integrin alpha-5 isoform X1 [Pleuronectes platessa]